MEDNSRDSDRFYLPQLDGLRFFAFAGVFGWHFFGEWADAHLRNPANSLASQICVKGIGLGGAGVDVFFALSAYLITELLLRERRKFGAINLRSFYIRRILRIWPLYYGALSLVLAGWVFFPSLGVAGKYLPYFAIFAGNFALCRWDTPALFAPLWSVSVEEQFYVLWPLAVSRLSRGGMMLIASALWLLAIGFRLWMGGAPQYAIMFHTLARLDPIAAGILVAAYLDGRTRVAIGPSAVWLVGLIFFLLSDLAYVSRVWPTTRLWGVPLLSESFIGLGSAAFLVGAIASGPRGWLASRPLVYLGRISYGLYVFHMAAIALGGAIFGFPTGVARYVLMAGELALTIMLAAASYRWFERPFLDLKVRFQRVASGNQRRGGERGYSVSSLSPVAD